MNENEATNSIFDLFVVEESNKKEAPPRLFKAIVEEAKVDSSGAWYKESSIKYLPEEKLSWQNLERLYEEAVRTYDELPNQLKIKFKQNLIQAWITEV